MLEGEEEIGSESLYKWCEENKELVAGDVILISDTSMIAWDIPSITCGLRGLTYMQVEVTGPDKDLHSGLYGGAVANPANVLAEMIASLVDDKGHITIPGFYDDVRELSAEEREEFNKAPFSKENYMKGVGVEELAGEEGYTTPERTGVRPTLDVNGMWSGYIGEGTKTIIPSTASAKISMRLVPHQDYEKIAELFEEAAKKAPTVICFDELDGMVPDRSTIHNEGASGEVNEFLSQLNNCSERGIFVIGTSNRPEKIDPAILRTGRMDKMVYIPMPDVEARKELFKIHLADRYCDESLDLDELAKQSDGYVASDISFMVNASALEAAMADVPISQELVLAEMRKARRSVTKDDAADYERMRKKFEQQTPRQERRRIGF